MMLTEVTPVAANVLPLAEFRDHLRLGTGFADTGAEDVALQAYLRAAIAAIEGRTAKALISREFKLVLGFWRGHDGQALPLSPVSTVSALKVLDAAGAAVLVDPTRYRLVPDLARPRLEAVSGALPSIPNAGQVEIAFVAGFGPAWSDVPVDLAQAVLMLAAQYYEMRHDGAGEAAAMPFGVMALIERWRTVRVLGGRS